MAASLLQRRSVRFLLAAAPALYAFALALRPVDNFDLGFILRIGERVARSGIPTTDPFSFPGEGQPWALEQWVGPWLFWMAHVAGGIRAVIFLKAAICGAAILVAQRAARLACGDDLLASLAALLGAAACEPRFNAQPNVLTTLAVACVVCLLLRVRATGSPRAAWLLLPLFAGWVHVHPGYLSGGAFVAAFLAGAAGDTALRRAPWTRTLVVRVAGICALAAAAAVGSLALFHPMHLTPLVRVLGIFNSGVSRSNIVEYSALGQAYALNAPILALLLLPPLGWLVARRVPLALALPWLLFGVAELRVGRLVAEASVVLAPVAAHAVAEALRRLHREGKVRDAPHWAAFLPMAAALAGAALHFADPLSHPLDWPPPLYPRACYAFIDRTPLPARGFNDLWFGGSFIFHFDGARRTFIDGRSFYSDRFFVEDYLPIRDARPGWQEVVKKWGIEWFLLAPWRFRGLHEALQRSGYRQAYRDDTCVIYVKPD